MLNKYFKRSEFACHCSCGFDTVDARLVEILTEVREHFGLPVVINSSCRCQHHNAAVGGKPHSYHLAGRAADIRIPGVQPDQVYDFINSKYPDTLGLICYMSFVHVDTRTGAAYRKAPL